jgi:hypothetical protein
MDAAETRAARRANSRREIGEPLMLFMEASKLKQWISQQQTAKLSN